MVEKKTNEKSGGLITIHEGKEYIIRVDKGKNRLFFEFIGKMNEPTPDYVTHTREAVDMLQRGFTVFSVVPKTTGTPSLGWTTQFKNGLKIMVDGGVSKTGVVMEKALHRMVLNVVSKLSGLVVEVFSRKEDAEKWLDEGEVG